MAFIDDFMKQTQYTSPLQLAQTMFGEGNYDPNKVTTKASPSPGPAAGVPLPTTAPRPSPGPAASANVGGWREYGVRNADGSLTVWETDDQGNFRPKRTESWETNQQLPALQDQDIMNNPYYQKKLMWDTLVSLYQSPDKDLGPDFLTQSMTDASPYNDQSLRPYLNQNHLQRINTLRGIIKGDMGFGNTSPMDYPYNPMDVALGAVGMGGQNYNPNGYQLFPNQGKSFNPFGW